MTLQECLDFLSARPAWVAAGLALPPAGAAALGLAQPRVSRLAAPPLSWDCGAVVYAAYAPGTMATSLLVYELLFRRANLLRMSVFTTLLPSLSMVLTLWLVGCRVDFTPLPGFERLFSLITLLALTCAFLLVLDRMRVIVVFGGSIFVLLAIGIVCFLVMSNAAGKLFR